MGEPPPQATGDLAAFVDEAVARAVALGSLPSIVQGRRRCTAEAFAQDVRAVAGSLARRGLSPTDVVLFGVLPGIDGLVLLLACWRAGARVEFVEPARGRERFEQQLATTPPTWVMVDTVLYAASARTPLRRHLRRRGVDLPRLAALPATHLRFGRRIPGIVPAGPSLDDLRAEARSPGAPVLPSEVPDVEGVSASFRALDESLGLPSEALVLVRGLGPLLACIVGGVRCVVAPRAFTAAEFLDDIELHSVTHAFLSPAEAAQLAMYRARRNKAWPETLQHVLLTARPGGSEELEAARSLAGAGVRFVDPVDGIDWPR